MSLNFFENLSAMWNDILYSGFCLPVDTIITLTNVEDLELGLVRARTRLENNSVRAEQVLVEPVTSGIGSYIGYVRPTSSIWNLIYLNLF